MKYNAQTLPVALTVCCCVAYQEAVTNPEAALQALADGQAASLDQLQDNLVGPSTGAVERDGSATAGPSGLDRPRAPGSGGRARRKSGIIMSELGANLKPLPPSAATVSHLPAVYLHLYIRGATRPGWHMYPRVLRCRL